jgi:hypothetical protein
MSKVSAIKRKRECGTKPLQVTSGLAQTGVWLARKFVGIFNICARASGSETPAFAKPPPRYLSFWDSTAHFGSEKNTN